MKKILSVDSIGKAYTSYRSEWHRFANWFGASIAPENTKWVLEEISFSINEGEAVALIGQNGAGKSTLLKLITGTIQPTKGNIQINGRISAILELGMGFNPDLTGRQNAYHAIGLMGFSAKEAQELMPHIEAFSEIGSYFDTPIRTYSSGMQMRVAFAIVTAHRPEILIIDEALSVGDAYFQHKCFALIKKHQSLGTTLLIVSHDRTAIQNLCSRAILVDEGKILRDADPEEAFDYYNAIIAKKEGSDIKADTVEDGRVKITSGTGEAKVSSISITDTSGKPLTTVPVGEKVEILVKVSVQSDLDTLVLGYGIKDRLGQVMYGTNTWHTKQIIENPREGDEYQFKIAFQMNLGVGSYSVQTALVDSHSHLTANYEWQDLALIFEVINTDKTFFAGCSWIEPQIELSKF